MSSGKLLAPGTSGPNVGHGRILTAADYQLVSLYTDLKRSDIEYLQSIAGVYDVTQMRGLLRCKLDQIEQRRRYLAHERNTNFDAYRAYLDKTHSNRRSNLMPALRSQQRQQKPIPRITDYPVIRGQRLIGSKKDRARFEASDRTQLVDRQMNKDSTTSTRDEPALLEITDSAVRGRTDDDAPECAAGKSKKTVRTEKSVEKLDSNKQPYQSAGVRGSVRLKRTPNKPERDPASTRVNAEVRKIVRLAVCKRKEFEAARKRCADKEKKAAEKASTSGSFGPENELPVPSANEDLPDCCSRRELVVPVEEEEEEGKDEESPICPDGVGTAYGESKEYSPEVARSESLGEELDAVFSRETNPDYLTPFETPDDSDNDDDDDDDDIIAEYARHDDPLESYDDDDDDDKRLRLNNRKGSSTSECESMRHQLDKDTVADYAVGNAPLLNELPIQGSVSNVHDNYDEPSCHDIDVDKKDSFFDAYDARGRPIKQPKEGIRYGIKAGER